MKKDITRFKKALLAASVTMVVVFAVAVAPSAADAALSESTQRALKDLAVKINSDEELKEAIDYLASKYGNETTTTTSGSTSTSGSTDTSSTSTGGSSTSGTSTGSLLCQYINSLSKNLSVNTSDAQVQNLQRALNVIASQDRTKYDYVSVNGGAGSIGRETTYFGVGTQSALAKWKSVHMGMTFNIANGTLDEAARAKLKQVYCGGNGPTSGSGSTTGGTSTGSTTSGSTGSGDTKTVTTSRGTLTLTADKATARVGEEIKLTYRISGYGDYVSCRISSKYAGGQSLITPNSIAPSTSAPKTGTFTPSMMDSSVTYTMLCSPGGSVYDIVEVTVGLAGSTSSGSSSSTSGGTTSSSQPYGVPPSVSGNAAIYSASNSFISFPHVWFSGTQQGAFWGMTKYGTSKGSCDELPNHPTEGSGAGGSFYGYLPASSLSANTTYYYCYQATMSDGRILATSPVMSFKVSDMLNSQLSLSLSPSSGIKEGDQVTVQYSTMGHSGCMLYHAANNGVAQFQTPVPAAPSGTQIFYAFKARHTFTLRCDNGYQRQVELTVD